MRRISMQYARPGIVLSMDIYDNYGNVVLTQGTRLTLDNVASLEQMGGGELFFDDHRVDDVPVTPLMPARLEGDAARRLNKVLAEISAVTQGQTGGDTIDTDPVEKVAFSMVQQLFPVVMGEVNATGCFSLRDYNFVHPVQVASLAILMGRKSGYKEDMLHKLCIAALLENIGYVVLPAGMMDEPGPLLPIEKHEVHQHCQYGFQLLRDYAEADDDIATTVLQHHERWDGSGYPRGMKEDTVHPFARIIGIADTYYALVSRRPHRQSHLPHEAIEFIMAFSGELFDPELVRLFTKLVPLYPTGVMVDLNTGEQGIVADARPGFIGRPTVRVCYDQHKRELSPPIDIDLTESANQHRLVTDVVEY